MRYGDKQIKQLIQKDMPSHRKAYSDRTAWLMATLSDLAYIDHEVGKQKLKQHLEKLGLDLVQTFDQNDTQAILVKSEKRKFIALAFRGTEKSSIKDIKTDCKAHLSSDLGDGRMHSGFNDAYEDVEYDIQSAIGTEEYEDMPLFITGHSLGGALATLAAKKLEHKAGIAACYTFGSPRVGDQNWIADMKSPVYRVVNAADCVPLLPPSSDTIEATCWVFDSLASLVPIPILSPMLKKSSSYLREYIGGYMHCGSMRYLTNCHAGQLEQVQLLYSVSFWRRVKSIITKKTPWKRFLSDHSIKVYKNKLFVIACRRNP